jgi:hypothetical protein
MGKKERGINEAQRRREGGHGAHIDETQKSRVRKNRSEVRVTGVHIGCVVGGSAGSKEGVSMRWTMSGVRKKAQGVRLTLRVITTRVKTEAARSSPCLQLSGTRIKKRRTHPPLKHSALSLGFSVYARHPFVPVPSSTHHLFTLVPFVLLALLMYGLVPR